MQVSDELSVGTFRHILGDIVEKVSNPDGARLLLRDTHNRLTQRTARDGTAGLSDAMLEYLVLGLGRYVSGQSESLDEAFGVKRKRGARPTREDRHGAIAVDVLARMNERQTLEAASAETARAFHLSQSRVQDVYAEHVRENGPKDSAALRSKRDVVREAAALASKRRKRP